MINSYNKTKSDPLNPSSSLVWYNEHKYFDTDKIQNDGEIDNEKEISELYEQTLDTITRLSHEQLDDRKILDDRLVFSKYNTSSNKAESYKILRNNTAIKSCTGAVITLSAITLLGSIQPQAIEINIILVSMVVVGLALLIKGIQDAIECQKFKNKINKANNKYISSVDGFNERQSTLEVH